jgi:hypothetical protein
VNFETIEIDASFKCGPTKVRCISLGPPSL